MGEPQLALQRSFSFRRGTDPRGNYFVLLHTADPPSDEDWNDYVQAIAATLQRGSGRVQAFVATDGGGPNASQRRRLADAFEHGDAMTWVFTTDLLVRGIVTAFRWIARARASAFPPDDFARVCEDCGIEPEQILADMVATQMDMPPVRTLHLIQRVGRQSLDPHPKS